MNDFGRFVCALERTPLPTFSLSLNSDQILAVQADIVNGRPVFYFVKNTIAKLGQYLAYRITGVLVNPEILLDEVRTFDAGDRVFIDPQCGVITKEHIEKDNTNYPKMRIGTTGTGTGPANADRALRTLKMARDVPELLEYIDDVSSDINCALDKKERVIIEGTQGTFLSLYYGEYPFVTSKDVTSSAICSDVGVGPKRVDEVLLVLSHTLPEWAKAL